MAKRTPKPTLFWNLGEIAVLPRQPPGFVIYGLAEPDTGEIRYVGKCCGYLNSRISGHISEAASGRQRTYKTAWIRGLLAQGQRPLVKVFERADSAEALLALEQKWIATLRSYGCRLTNLTDGGEGALNPSPSTRRKLRNRPRPELTEERREAMRRHMIERWKDPAVRERHREQQMGRHRTHCKRGHPMSGDNLYISPKGIWTCRACAREGVRRYSQTDKAKATAHEHYLRTKARRVERAKIRREARRVDE